MEKYFKPFEINQKKKRGGPTLSKESNFSLLFEYNYTISDIKSALKCMKIQPCKKTRKNDIIIYAANMMRLTHHIQKIQKCWKNHFISLFNNTLGPSFRNKKLSNNIDDFFTAEDIDEIDYYNFFSYKDRDGFVYTFNIISIYTLIAKKTLENPYNRSKFDNDLIRLVERRIRFNRILKQTQIFEEYKPKETSIESKINNVFARIDELGNYSNPSWLLNLNAPQLRRFLFELFEIWNFRAQLTQARRIEISPPNGTPFVNIPRTALAPQSTVHSFQSLRAMCLCVMEKLVYRAVSDSDKNMGALYILGALTLVSTETRDALPWLYASVSYIN